jgi:cell division protein FtsL
VIRAASTKARPRAGATARVLRVAAAAALLVALGVFHIWSRTRVLATGYELGELAKEHARLASEHDRLRIEVETLRSPSGLERYARTRLGMAPPAPGTVLAAGPRLASATAGGAGVDGVGHRSGPAEPLLRPEAVLASAGRAPPGTR